MLFLDVKRRNQITCTSGTSAAYKWNCENGVRACMWARVRVCVRANAEQKRAKGDLMVMWNEKCQSNRRSQKWKEAQQQTTAAALQATLWRRQTELTNTWMLNNLYAGKKAEAVKLCYSKRRTPRSKCQNERILLCTYIQQAHKFTNNKIRSISIDYIEYTHIAYEMLHE